MPRENRPLANGLSIGDEIMIDVTITKVIDAGPELTSPAILDSGAPKARPKTEIE